MELAFHGGQGGSAVATIRDRAEIRELSLEEGWDLLEKAAQRELHMSAKEFLETWEAGKFDDPDRPEIMRVAMLLPFIAIR